MKDTAPTPLHFTAIPGDYNLPRNTHRLVVVLIVGTVVLSHSSCRTVERTSRSDNAQRTEVEDLHCTSFMNGRNPSAVEMSKREIDHNCRGRLCIVGAGIVDFDTGEFCLERGSKIILDYLTENSNMLAEGPVISNLDKVGVEVVIGEGPNVTNIKTMNENYCEYVDGLYVFGLSSIRNSYDIYEGGFVGHKGAICQERVCFIGPMIWGNNGLIGPKLDHGYFFLDEGGSIIRLSDDLDISDVCLKHNFDRSSHPLNYRPEVLETGPVKAEFSYYFD